MSESVVNVGWNGFQNGAGEYLGFNDSGLEHFNDNPLAALAREASQNSQDASDGSGLPVHMDVNVISVPREDFPGADDLLSVMRKCLPNAKIEGEKPTFFFENAEKILSADTIDVLAITDLNTTGTKGPCIKGKPFYALLKASGATIKENHLAKGSYGIGKNAPYANSGLRCVFVSTAFKDENGIVRRLVQGKTMLISYDSDDGSFTWQGRLYWGSKDNFMPLDPDSAEGNRIPGWLTAPHENGRLGTTVFVVAFNGCGGWEKEFAAHYMQTFFGSIHEGRATANIGGLDVNMATLPELFQDETILAAIKNDLKTTEAFTCAKAYYEAFTSSSSEKISIDVGDIFNGGTLDLLVGNGLPKRVAVLRNDMLITDRMDSLKRFGSMLDFAAVLRFNSDAANSALRQMEPPRHDAFDIARIHDVVLRKRVGHAIKALSDAIRAEIEKRTRGAVTEVSNISELSDLLGKIGKDGQQQTSDKEMNPLGRVHFVNSTSLSSSRGQQKGQVKKMALGNQVVATGGGSSHEGDDNPPSGPSERERIGGGETGSSTASTDEKEKSNDVSVPDSDDAPGFKPFSLSNLRGFQIEDGRYQMSFTPVEDGQYGFRFAPNGVRPTSKDEFLKVLDVDVKDAAVDPSGMLRVPGVAGSKVFMRVRFASLPKDSAVKVVSYAI